MDDDEYFWSCIYFIYEIVFVFGLAKQKIWWEKEGIQRYTRVS